MRTDLNPRAGGSTDGQQDGARPAGREDAAPDRARAVPRRTALRWSAAALGLGVLPASGSWAQAVAPAWRATAEQVARQGVPLSALSPRAPSSYIVKPGDTLWDIAALFLKSPWRWPELWGMNLQQVRNPHLIYPGQRLVLIQRDGRAWLSFGADAGGMPTVKLLPRVRSQLLPNGAIASVPLHLIAPFLNEAVVLEHNALAAAPRIVATQEGRVLVSRGDLAYVRGELGGMRQFTLYRNPKALTDPTTREVLGYEAAYVGEAELLRSGLEGGDGSTVHGLPVPATVQITASRLEAGIGDRLAPAMASDLDAFMPRAPQDAIAGEVVSIYGDSVAAGGHQVVAINRGAQQGLARGHVLSLWRAGRRTVDPTWDRPRPEPIQLPDEANGHLFVFRVFDRTAYALVMGAQDAVQRGDRFSQPSD